MNRGTVYSRVARIVSRMVGGIGAELGSVGVFESRGAGPLADIRTYLNEREM